MMFFQFFLWCFQKVPALFEDYSNIVSPSGYKFTIGIGMGEVSSEKGKMQGFKLTFFILILGIFGEGAEKMNIKNMDLVKIKKVAELFEHGFEKYEIINNEPERIELPFVESVEFLTMFGHVISLKVYAKKVSDLTQCEDTFAEIERRYKQLKA